MALCSMAVVINRLAPVVARRARAMPRNAALSLSVPPLVKMNSPGRALSSPAKVWRAVCSVTLALRPARWMLEGLPNVSARWTWIVSSTSARIGVVAAWSR
jgi:hypothetical protein